MQILEHEMELPFSVAVQGEEMGQMWQTFRPSDLKQSHAEYSYEVSVGSMLPRTPEVEREQWLALQQTVLSNPFLALNEALVRKTAKLFQFEDDLLIEGLMQMAQAMIQDKMQNGSKGQASQPKEGDKAPRNEG